ncbi:MAG: TlpA disulfide reductase family protein [Bacteroidales bacterium]|nr:TlpA disulfide reductase family protein [Bacteroidales bacterium]
MKTLMQRLIPILLSFTVALGALQAQTATMKGQLKEFEKYPVGIIVNEVSPRGLTPLDTFYTNAKGKYEISLAAQTPSLYVFTFDYAERSPMLHVMVMPGEKVTLDLRHTSDIDFVVVDKVNGSRNMEAYKQFNAAMYEPLARSLILDTEFRDSNTSALRRQQLQEDAKQIMLQQRQWVRKVVEDNKDCLISAFLVTFLEDDFSTYANLFEQVRDALIERYPSNPYVQHLDQKVKSSLETGSLAPEIAMPNAQGDTLRLSNLRGKVVLVDFWASWCRPCRMENPNVVKLYKKYNPLGFEVFSVSLDSERTSWLKAIADDGLAWPNHVSDLRGWVSSGGTAYGVTSIPTTILIDAQGRVVAKNLRGKELAQKLQELFGE